MRFKIGWPSDIVGSKFTVLAFFYFVFQENFPGGLYLEGLIHGGPHFRKFTVFNHWTVILPCYLSKLQNCEVAHRFSYYNELRMNTATKATIRCIK